MKQKLLYLIALLIIFQSCSTVKVKKYKSEESVSTYYYLPKTQLNIKLKVLKTNYYKGPFSDYAKMYLGIENKVLKQNKEEYKIIGIDIKPVIINDDSSCYSVKLPKGQFITYIENSNVLGGINEPNNINNKMLQSEKHFSNDIVIPFKDRTVKPLVAEKSDTTWKTVLIDSVFKRIPKISKAIAPRTIKEQAYLASKFILKIRKRRLRVLTGMDEKYPDGKAMKLILKELKRLEENYLRLFTGYAISDTAEYVFNFIPTLDNKNEVLAYFSKQKGILKNEGNELKVNIKFNPLINSRIEQAKGIIYKIPAASTIEILKNNEILKTQVVPIYQYGSYSIFKYNKGAYLYNVESGTFIKK